MNLNAQKQFNGNLGLTPDGTWTVDKILGKRGKGSGVRYRIRWLGWQPDMDTWEPRRNLASALELIQELYEASIKPAAAPRPEK